MAGWLDLVLSVVVWTVTWVSAGVGAWVVLFVAGFVLVSGVRGVLWLLEWPERVRERRRRAGRVVVWPDEGEGVPQDRAGMLRYCHGEEGERWLW